MPPFLLYKIVYLLQFGGYYNYDSGVLHDAFKTQFKSKLKDSFDYYFSLLYSLYSLPNIILPFIAGLLIIKFGNRSMYIVFGSLITIGQLIFAIGCKNSSIKTMLVGRFIFGLGGESINISKNEMIVKWFYKSQMALPYGLSISISRMLTVLNNILSPRLVESVFNF